MHNELLRLLEQEEGFRMPDEAFLSAVAYRPAQRNGASAIDVWPMVLAIGEPLPVLPLALRGTHAVPLNLEATYAEARERARS